MEYIYIYYIYYIRMTLCPLIVLDCVSLLVSTDPALAWIATNENLLSKKATKWKWKARVRVNQHRLASKWHARQQKSTQKGQHVTTCFLSRSFCSCSIFLSLLPMKNYKMFFGSKRKVLQKYVIQCYPEMSSYKMISHPNNVTPKTASKIYVATKWIALTAQAELNFL